MISDAQILRAAKHLLRRKSAITPRDVYYALCDRPSGGVAPMRPLTLMRISKVLMKNGYRIVQIRSRGYTLYRAGDDPDG